jgi:hypothetical protein
MSSITPSVRVSTELQSIAKQAAVAQNVDMAG